MRKEGRKGKKRKRKWGREREEGKRRKENSVFKSMLVEFFFKRSPVSKNKL